jgi:exosortase
MMRTTLARPLAAVLVVAVSIAWSYWPTLGTMVEKWTADPQYSHGYFVPVFVVFLLWLRREELRRCPYQPTWWGLGPLLAGFVLRLTGTLLYFDWLEMVSLLPILAGAILLLRGWPTLRCSWPALAFLGFMFPLPYSIERALSQPLQSVATRISAYALQTMGFPAFADGNVIIVNETNIGVVEACNGLGMLILFFALATGVAMLVRMPLPDRLVIVASAGPIAVVANVARIVVTAVFAEFVGRDAAKLIFHDLAGWLMMPLALGMLFVELQILSRLLIEVPVERTMPTDYITSPPASSAAARA